MTIIATLPEKWCILADSYLAAYEANKVYLGKENNLARTVNVDIKWRFKDRAEQKEFFDWWAENTQYGALPFYANLPLYADAGIAPDKKYYLLAQAQPLTQSVSPHHTISGKFILFKNTTKSMSAPPIARDVDAVVDESSNNNVIMLDASDPDGSSIEYSFAGDHDGATIRGASIVFTPPKYFVGEKIIGYKATDSTGLESNVALVKIYVNRVGAPIAKNMTAEVYQSEELSNTSTTKSRYITPDAYDPDGKPLTIIIIDAGKWNATADGSKIKIEVSAANAPVGDTDQIKYQVTNGARKSQIATCDVTIIAGEKPNVPVDDLDLFFIRSHTTYYTVNNLFEMFRKGKDANGIDYTVTIDDACKNVQGSAIDDMLVKSDSVYDYMYLAIKQNSSGTVEHYTTTLKVENVFGYTEIPVVITIGTLMNERYDSIDELKGVWVSGENSSTNPVVIPFPWLGYPKEDTYPQNFFDYEDAEHNTMDALLTTLTATVAPQCGSIVFDVNELKYSSTFGCPPGESLSHDIFEITASDVDGNTHAIRVDITMGLEFE